MLNRHGVIFEVFKKIFLGRNKARDPCFMRLHLLIVIDSSEVFKE